MFNGITENYAYFMIDLALKAMEIKQKIVIFYNLQ